ncbi:MAG: hypothetical protein ACXAEU_00145 [Candidatus Hodarchaeales archaeon]|jgi:hypothetical protein
MNNFMVVRYAITILAVLISNLLVYIIFPGNWLGAVILGFIALVVILPSRNGCNTDSSTKNDSITCNDISQSIEQQDLKNEKIGFHSMLGNVFNTMALNAGHDLYSSEITGTSEQFQKQEVCKRSATDEVFSKAINNQVFPRDGEGSLINVKLKVGPDGKFHYIFQESDFIASDNDSEQKKSLDEFQEKILGLGNENWKKRREEDD